jgi:DNA-3-methyladenine glycosylase
MFGPPGHAYVYLIYGLHHCVNAVCSPAGRAEAVLIRALEPRFDLEPMRRNRGGVQDRDLARGPARLCQALRIDRSLDGVDLCHAAQGLWVGRNPQRDSIVRDDADITVSRRIGITKAAELPLRYHLAGSPWVSRG